MRFLRAIWEPLNFLQRGSYSIERLNAFNNYCRLVPVWRSVLVCSIFFLPALLSSIALELIPLQNPYDGVRANYGAWVRNFFIVFTNTISVLVQINQLIPQLLLSFARILSVAVAASCCYMVMVIAIALYWVYPTPFGLVISIPLGSVFVVCFFLLAVGLDRIRSSASLQQELTQQIKILAAQIALAVVYPIFIAVCRHLSPMHRLFFVVLLPLIKLLMQQFIAWSARDLEDHQPGIVVFCVDVFNAIYASKSMQSTSLSARLTPFVIFGIDLLAFTLVVKHLYRQESHVHRLRFMFNQQRKRTLSPLLNQPLVNATIDLSEQPGVLSTDETSLIRVHSSIHHSFSFHSQTAIQPIVRGHITPHNLLRKTIKTAPTLVQVMPANILDKRMAPRAPSPSHNKVQLEELSLREKQKLLLITLKLLFQCEYHLLVKYVECVVPLMYAIYVAIVELLPCAQFYPETRNLAASQSKIIVINLLVYAGLETLLFLFLLGVLKKRCGFSPTYLLAFVLENQALEFQSRLFLWYIILLQFTLVHFGAFAIESITLKPLCELINVCAGYLAGVDFTLRFAWLDDGK